MKARFVIALLSIVMAPLVVTAAPQKPAIFPGDQIHWMAGSGPFKGTQVAVLFGNPAKPGPFTIRLKLADGTKFGPHYHGDLERVTVISGALSVGLGDKMVAASMQTLGAGSYVAIPAKLHHYAMAKGATVIQLDGTGPMTMIAVK